jgi:hypothetical protein
VPDRADGEIGPLTDTGRAGGLTTDQAATLTGLLPRIRGELGC